MRRAAACVCAALALLLAAPLQAAGDSTPARPLPADATALPNPHRGAGRAYLVVADGVPLWGDAVAQPLPPASLTKLMTALIVADAIDPRTIVTVSATAARAGGARIGLPAGMRIKASELLAAMLLRSANDACVALAEAVAGSERRFVAQMNERARVLGLAESHFANACGFDAPGHLSSARDLAALARLVVANPGLARLVARDRYTARAEDGRTWNVASTNALLGLVPGLRGVKTGYTAKAGRCLVGYAERDGHDVMVVILDGGDRWWDAVAMIEQAFERVGRPSGVPGTGPASTGVGAASGAAAAKPR